MKGKDIKPGQLVKFTDTFGKRTCKAEKHERDVLLTDVQDGWQGFTYYPSVTVKDVECSLVTMPKTPAELIEFIREYQIRPEDEYDG